MNMGWGGGVCHTFEKNSGFTEASWKGGSHIFLGIHKKGGSREHCDVPLATPDMPPVVGIMNRRRATLTSDPSQP